MADLTEVQKNSYWRYNVTLTTVLLIIWFVVTYLISGLWAGWLNQFSFLGFHSVTTWRRKARWQSSSLKSPCTPI